ncbi:RidA family protein [Streptomyces dysideae]|uniref:Reactive intermediate/imine deaminase n=1 Tax=Streptomyces dysideae TaxID=909626 RepID=A0A101UT55_9ACTN|nr:Rid family detoxifying hydrolase [Streptomyces dysideae]KUO16405.1 reactive intermediate/imine deaminase [Streptomyces dysideae]
MNRNTIDAAGAPAAVGPYSHAVRHGGLLFLSGQAPFDPQTGEVVAGGIEAQTRQVFANLESVLTAGGSSFTEVLKVNVYLTDLDDFEAVNAIYGEVFTEPYPARTTIAAAGLPLGAAVEIELVARDSQS